MIKSEKGKVEIKAIGESEIFADLACIAASLVKSDFKPDDIINCVKRGIESANMSDEEAREKIKESLRNLIDRLIEGALDEEEA